MMRDHKNISEHYRGSGGGGGGGGGGNQKWQNQILRPKSLSWREAGKEMRGRPPMFEDRITLSTG